jgi:hypothetical protein
MASNNQLLGSGKPVEEPIITEEKNKSSFERSWLYHSTCREGKLIETEDEYNKLLKEGWRDRLDKVVLIAGREEFFEGKISKESKSIFDKGK